MFNVARSIGTVLCCKCGISIPPNAANMCANCLRSEVDITEGLERRSDLAYCPECRRYEQPPSAWIRAELESKELLTLCLKKLKKLNTLRVVHAEFVWTEPHSKRIRVKLRVQKEVIHGAILEQAYVVEYVVQDKLCGSCSRLKANPDQWDASVQLRQIVPHRRTFFYLEQVILKHDAARDAVRIQQTDRGIDFFFSSESHANRFVNFIEKFAPVKVGRNNVQLVSHDSKSNKGTHKYNFSVLISPVCREDLVCLPPRLAAKLGNFGPLVICHKVTNTIALLDPLTLRECFVDAKQYWGFEFKALLSSRQLTEYIVLDLEPVASQGGSKYLLADAHVARVSDLGRNERYSIVRTHLGRVLRPGDYALGYDLCGANTNDLGFERLVDIPDVILIKKRYGAEKRERRWKLKPLKMEGRDDGEEEEKRESEYEAFLRDLEENPDLRFNLSLYSNDAEEVPLDEMLANLDLSHGNIHMAG